MIDSLSRLPIGYARRRHRGVGTIDSPQLARRRYHKKRVTSHQQQKKEKPLCQEVLPSICNCWSCCSCDYIDSFLNHYLPFSSEMASLISHYITRVKRKRVSILKLGFVASFLLFVIYFVSPIGRAPIATYVPPQKPLDPQIAQTFHNLNPVVQGWGENGAGVELDDEQQKIADVQFKQAAFNVYTSDRISPNRTLPDVRPNECALVKYHLNELGDASVIIIYTNEIWSALIRTIWSVINRTPSVLLKEIILVDDFSDREDLKEPLDKYIQYYFPSLVKIIRLEKRSGLITARLAGARLAKGSTLVFLDSHCETIQGWLEPLLKTVRDDYRNVVCPVIDIISDKTMEYVSGQKYFFQVGGFIWSGHFVWLDINEDRLKHQPTKPVKSPTMAGGLFAIDRNYFFESGSYDEKMEIWGGENLEMSFRLWQCGGKIFIHGCSHVGHIFRDYHPYSFLGKDTHAINTVRTVKVWMDEYQRYFFMHRKDLIEPSKTIDVSERLKLREHLGCKSFKWYLDNVYTEKKFIYDQDAQAFGRIRNPISSFCIDNLNRPEDSKHDIGVYPCLTSTSVDEWTNEMFSFRTNGQIRREETCLSIEPSTNLVKMSKCLNLDIIGSAKLKRARIRQKYQLWTHTKGGQIKNVKTGKCLTTAGLEAENNLAVDECNTDDLYQIWWFQKYTDIDVQLLPN